MMHWRYGVISGLTRQWEGVDQFVLQLAGKEISALAYRAIVGELAVGDRVLVNVTALHRGLGTGGLGFIIAPAGSLPADPPDAPGHIVKARYLPQQQMVEAVEEQDSPHHPKFLAPAPLTNVPVVVADLHSSLPAIICGIRLSHPEAKVGYVMSDGAALPIGLSYSVAQLRQNRQLCGTVTCGQAFGGDLEATSIANGIIAAHRVLAADVVVVTQGPGNVGTGSSYGFSGLDTSWHLQQAALVGALPIAVLRASSADQRPRHFGLSHHSLTVLRDATPIRVEVPIPELSQCPADLAFADDLAQLRQKHRIHQVPCDGLDTALTNCVVPLRTMGRSFVEDPLAFRCAGAGGIWAASQIQ